MIVPQGKRRPRGKGCRYPHGTVKEHMMEQTTGIPGDAVKVRPGLDGRIRRYWTRRSDAFGQVRREELQSDKSSL